MASELTNEIEVFFDEGKSFLSQNEYYGALKRYSNIYNCLPKLSDRERHLWSGKIRQLNLTDEIIGNIKVKIRTDIDRIERIISIGTEFVMDEILQVLTLKINVDLLNIFLIEFFDYTLVSEQILCDVDEDIEKLFNTRANKQLLYEAVSLIRINWGLPIDHKWLRLQ